MKLPDLVLIVTTASTALMSGFFYAYSISVSPGLSKVPDKAFIETMQNINREVQNPFFFSCFFGTLILLSLSAILFRDDPVMVSLLSTGSLLYILGVFGTTVLFNVPLNNYLAGCDPETATEENITAVRQHFEGKWTSRNHIRSICSFISLLASIVACVVKHA